MTYKICYWDEKEGVQKERDSTLEEDAQREIDIQAAANAFPKVVTALQGLLALDQSGMAEAYDSWASNPSRTFAEKAFINKALYWRYDDDVLNAGCQALGITEAQKKQLFILAATL